MSTDGARISQFADVRRGEWRPLVTTFATLLLIITGHSTLETARDALVLTRLPPQSLAIVYVAVAICVLPAVRLSGRVTARMGPRKALAGGLVTATVLLLGLYALLVHRSAAAAVAVTVYVTSGLIGAVLVPVYWNLLASIFNVAQGRRLLRFVGAGGVLGGALGSWVSAALLTVVHSRTLLLVSAGVFLFTSCVVFVIPAGAEPARAAAAAGSNRRGMDALRGEPFLRRIALLVVVSTAAALFVDYSFKWTIARTVPHHEIARFVARTYAWLNLASLLAQILVTGALLRRIGVARAVVVTPLLLLGGAGGYIVLSALWASLALKVVDGTLHNSVYRTTTELLYLPVSAAARERAKPFIDGVIARLTQAVAGILLLTLGQFDYLSSPRLAAIAAAAILVWLAVAITARGPYFAMLRRAVAADPAAQSDVGAIDIESAETLVELLAHPDSLVVLGAMGVLERRGRVRLIPALILLHEDEQILVRALGIFGASSREDWVERATHALHDRRESVRTAAARALAMHGRLDAGHLAFDADPRLKAYAALHLSVDSASSDLVEVPAIAAALERPGPEGDAARLGLVAGIVDAKPDERLARLLEVLATRVGTSGEATAGVANAAAAQQVTALVPELVSRLVSHDARETVRTSLLALGHPALDELTRTLFDTARERRLRIQVPHAIARFETTHAAEKLLQCIETEGDGLVRYRALLALGRITATRKLTVDRVRVERIAYANLVEYFRLLGLREPFVGRPAPDRSRHGTTLRLLLGLLDDKLRQALERTFRLLQVAHPRHDIRRVRLACESRDNRLRANASEFLDALLRRSDQRRLRELLLVEIDDLSAEERLARGSELVAMPRPATREAALATMSRDRDAALAALASLHAATVEGRPARVAIGGMLGDRAAIELSTIGQEHPSDYPQEQAPHA
jgi:AAA family ATP:ADP antiporter